jgi:hypothetical protein
MRACGTCQVEPVQNVLDALGRYTWHERAACRDHPSPDDFHAEGARPGSAPVPSSSTALDCLEACARCPVRVECLTEALVPWAVPFDVPERGPGARGIRAIRAQGCWGGSWDDDRRGVRGLTLGEAIEALEAGLELRLARRRRAVGEAGAAAEAGDEATGS